MGVEPAGPPKYAVFEYKRIVRGTLFERWGLQNDVPEYKYSTWNVLRCFRVQYEDVSLALVRTAHDSLAVLAISRSAIVGMGGLVSFDLQCRSLLLLRRARVPSSGSLPAPVQGMVCSAGRGLRYDQKGATAP